MCPILLSWRGKTQKNINTNSLDERIRQSSPQVFQHDGRQLACLEAPPVGIWICRLEGRFTFPFCRTWPAWLGGDMIFFVFPRKGGGYIMETNSFLFHGEFVPFGKSRKRTSESLQTTKHWLRWIPRMTLQVKLIVSVVGIGGIGGIVWRFLFPPTNQWWQVKVDRGESPKKTKAYLVANRYWLWAEPQGVRNGFFFLKIGFLTKAFTKDPLVDCQIHQKKHAWMAELKQAGHNLGSGFP